MQFSIIVHYFEINFQIQHGKKDVEWDINYKFSEKTTMTIAAETVLHEDFIGKI